MGIEDLLFIQLLTLLLSDIIQVLFDERTELYIEFIYAGKLSLIEIFLEIKYLVHIVLSKLTDCSILRRLELAFIAQIVPFRKNGSYEFFG